MTSISEMLETADIYHNAKHSFLKTFVLFTDLLVLSTQEIIIENYFNFLGNRYYFCRISLPQITITLGKENVNKYTSTNIF